MLELFLDQGAPQNSAVLCGHRAILPLGLDFQRVIKLIVNANVECSVEHFAYPFQCLVQHAKDTSSN